MNEMFNVRRSQDGDQVLKSLNGQFQSVTPVTTATYNVEDHQSGTIFTLNRAAGIAVTLPAAEVGLVYEFYITSTFTGTCTITADSSADTYTGMITKIDKDEKGSVVAFDEDIDTTCFDIPAAADYILTLDADTDGRFLGGHLKFVCVSDSKWSISGNLFGDGAGSHMFS